jgi:hypothetical protein
MTNQLENNIVFPPSPPTPVEETDPLLLIPGEFEYMVEHSRIMLQTAYRAITLTENWEFMKQPIDSFMLSSDTRVINIYNTIETLGYYGHSGFSYGWTMRQIQFIAKNGEQKYKELMEENKKNSN